MVPRDIEPMQANPSLVSERFHDLLVDNHC